MVELFFFPIVRPTKFDHRSPSKYNDGRARFITLPFIAQDPKAIEIVQVRDSARSAAFTLNEFLIQVILESILLRRQKNMKDHTGKPIVELPPKIVGTCAQHHGLHFADLYAPALD